MSPIDPTPDRHDSCHHQDTSAGDTFGGLGTSKEYCEEEARRVERPPIVQFSRDREVRPRLHWYCYRELEAEV